MNKDIKILNKSFANNNINKCVIKYKDKIFKMNEHFSFKYIENKEDKLELSLIEFEDIKDKSHIFQNCDLLEEFSLFKEQKEFEPENLIEKLGVSDSSFQNMKSKKMNEVENMNIKKNNIEEF